MKIELEKGKNVLSFVKYWSMDLREDNLNLIAKLWMNALTLELHLGESAKLRALRAKNVLACQRALRAYVLTSQSAMRAYVLTCQCALRAYMLTCLRVLRAYVLT